MTVPSTVSRVTYAGDGSSTAFPVSYYFLANSDLVVLLVDSVGNSTTQVLNTNYTVTGAGVLAGGTVTMLVAPPSGYTLIIYRDIAVTQLTDYAPNDPFPAESHERALDKLTMIGQRLKELVTRSLRLPDSDTSGASTSLPSPTARRALMWSADGLSLINSGSDPDAVATQAQASADSAAASAASALSSANSAADIYDQFDDRYLGSKAVAPTVDNDGNPLLTGALYFNSATNKLQLYNGVSWQDTATALPASFTSNLFNGTGAQTAFTLSSAPASLASIFVFVSGVAQRPTTDYTISGTTLTFVAAPPSGTNNVLAFVASTVAAGTPDNGSVSTVKLQDDAVTYAKMQNISATKRVLGRNTAAAGDAEEVTLSQLLDWIGTVSQGDILYRDAAGWARLAAGTNGQFLKTLGAGANPGWGDVSSSGSLIGYQLFTANGSYTKATNNPSYIIVEVIGGGGGGGGAASVAGTAGGGGGAGGYSFKKILNATLGASETVTIGTSGSAGSNTGGNGGNGGTTSFGTHATATGGSGGLGSTSASVNIRGGGGGLGASGDYNSTGGAGTGSNSTASGTTSYGGSGGNSVKGGGGAGQGNAAGTNNGTANSGSGGSGGAGTVGTGQVGGTGGTGLVIVWEYR